MWMSLNQIYRRFVLADGFCAVPERTCIFSSFRQQNLNELSLSPAYLRLSRDLGSHQVGLLSLRAVSIFQHWASLMITWNHPNGSCCVDVSLGPYPEVAATGIGNMSQRHVHIKSSTHTARDTPKGLKPDVWWYFLLCIFVIKYVRVQICVIVSIYTL